VADVVNNLTSTDTDKALSANQGKVLQDGKLNLSGGTMTGDLTIPDKIIHSGDTNTAIRFPSADTVTVETGGTERMRVNDTGVGIGTNDPTVKLDILGIGTLDTDIEYARLAGGPSTQPCLRVGGNNTTSITTRYVFLNSETVSGLAQPLVFQTGATERLRITSAGDVGIGTTDPATKLDVNGDVTVTGDLLFSGAARSIGTSTAHDLILKTNNTERGRILSSGEVDYAGLPRRIAYASITSGADYTLVIGSVLVVSVNNPEMVTIVIQGIRPNTNGEDLQIEFGDGSTFTAPVTLSTNLSNVSSRAAGNLIILELTNMRQSVRTTFLARGFTLTNADVVSKIDMATRVSSNFSADRIRLSFTSGNLDGVGSISVYQYTET
jgi:hypothetical protein